MTKRTLIMLSAGAAVGAFALAEPLAKAPKGDWPMWGGSPDRNMVSGETGLPTKWDLEKGENIVWTAPLGSQTYGNPVVAGGRIFVGTNNGGNLRKGIEGDKGIVLCFDEKTGKQLWQMTHDKLPTGRVNDWPEQGICSTACVVGDRVYYVSNRAELVCADVEGFHDGENDGPYTDEQYKEKEDGDIIWVYDLIEELGSFPHNLATSSPVVWENIVFINTSNGVDEGHLDLPMPDSPDFAAIDAKTGKLLWTGKAEHKVLHGGWSSPAVGKVAGEMQVVFAGGDGWAYGFEPKTGKLLWKFDLNPKDSVWQLGGRGTRNNIIATPVIHGDRVYLDVGQDPEHGEGVGHLYAIDATKRGDITESGKVWHLGGDDFHRSMSTFAIADGLLYASDLSGFLYCIDAATGKVNWKHDTFSAIWGSPYLADGKVYLGDEEGEVVVLAHGKEEKVLATNDMGNSVYTTPVAANGRLYVTNRRMLVAIQEGARLERKAAAK